MALTRLAAEKARLAMLVEEMLAGVPAGTEIRVGGGQAAYDSGPSAR